MINLQISSHYGKLIDKPAILSACAGTLKELNVTQTEIALSIIICGSRKIRSLNREFRHIDSSTDVLSFPSDTFDPDSNLRYLGDIIISYPQAQTQALLAGHPLMSEIILLAVHGILHLLGYDHENEKDKKRMWKIQGNILNSLAVHVEMLPEK